MNSKRVLLLKIQQYNNKILTIIANYNSAKETHLTGENIQSLTCEHLNLNYCAFNKHGSLGLVSWYYKTWTQ